MADTERDVRWARKNTQPIDAAAWVVAPIVLAFVSVAVLVVAENPFFLAAHGISPLILAIGIFLGIGIVTSFVWLVFSVIKRWTSPATFDGVASTFTAFSTFLALTAIAVRLLSTRLDLGLAWGLGSVVALAGAIAVTSVSRRVSAGRALLVIATGVTVFPLLAGVGTDLRSNDNVTIAFDETAERPPILLIVADELSYTAVSEWSGAIRPMFTNLAAFQKTSTTYTNAYATANATHLAIPTLLAGIPDATTIGEFPNPVRSSGGPLSWLQSKYRVATDSIYFQESGEGVPFVDLGAGPLLQEQSTSRSQNVRVFLADALAVTVQTAVPEPISALAPRLDDRWYDFWDLVPDPSTLGVGGDFIEVLTDDQQPGFTFVHSMISHTPYVRDYAGQFWSPNSLGLRTEGLGTNSVVELQRQVYIAGALDFDRQFGYFINELQQAGTYDETLIIVTADHGRTFPLTNTWRVGDDRDQRWRDVAHVPLMVKMPGQTAPEVVSGLRSTAQISRTILDTARASVSIRDRLAPPLSQDPSQLPVFWFDKRTGEAGVEEFEPFSEQDDWRPEHFEPRHPESPFAVEIDTDLIGSPVPADLTRVSSQPAEVDEASSPLRAIEASRPQGSCARGEGVGLVSHDGKVIGSMAWGAPVDGSVTGWAVVPEFETGTIDVWC